MELAAVLSEVVLPSASTVCQASTGLKKHRHPETGREKGEHTENTACDQPSGQHRGLKVTLVYQMLCEQGTTGLRRRKKAELRQACHARVRVTLGLSHYSDKERKHRSHQDYRSSRRLQGWTEGGQQPH